MINRALKKIVCIKYENILSALYIVYMICNIMLATPSMILTSILLHCMMLSCLYYGIYTTRQDIKKYVYELDPIRIPNILATKKEIFTKVFNNMTTTSNIKYNSFLNNSYE